MATVYITQELKQRTKDVINKMCKREISSDVPNYDATQQVEATQLYHMGCWGKDNMHLLNVIPKDWLRVETTATIRVTGQDDNGNEISFGQSFESKSRAFYGRPSTDYWNRAECMLTIAQIREMPEETLGRAELLRRWENEIVVRDIKARWSKVSDDITGFLDKCKSLNEAVKLFPTIRMYLHGDDIERLDRKVERPSQRKKLVEDVDTDGLTAAAIAAKLMASS